jgi:hypothetical protein
MAINVQFQNLQQANSEILKAFNSANSAKALEAYQPLDAKQRKLEKLRALQALKQSSGSDSLADISLNTDSLAIALQKAEGATLQAMLNLLSAKMIEQNKYAYINTDEDKQIDIKKKVEEKLKEHKDKKEEKKEEEQSKKDEEKKEDSAVDKLVNAAVTYFKELRDSIIQRYEKLLDAVSLKNLKKAFSEGLKMIAHYTYEVPRESFNEFVLEPLQDFRKDLNNKINDIVKNGVRTKRSASFSQTEIRSMLQKSLKQSQDKKLKSSVDKLESSMLVRKKLKPKITLSAKDLKHALHS